MPRWNPHLFRKEGDSKGYNSSYLDALIAQGKTSTAAGLPVVFSLAHLASLSRTLYADLRVFVSRQDIHAKDFPYKTFPISKRSGGKRFISVPTPPLMAVQRWIAREILNLIPVNPVAFAYVQHRKAREHAERHCGADWLLKIDIEDFFGSISELQVFSLFEQLRYPRLLAFEMARLCTRASSRRNGQKWKNHDRTYTIPEYSSKFVGCLPQGAPTSPALVEFSLCRP